MASTTYTVGLTEAKVNFNKIARAVNETGRPVTIFKRNKPYVTIVPASDSFNAETLTAIEELKDAPVHHDIEEIFDSIGI